MDSIFDVRSASAPAVQSAAFGRLPAIPASVIADRPLGPVDTGSVAHEGTMHFRTLFAALVATILCFPSAALAGAGGQGMAAKALPPKPVTLTEFNALKIRNSGPDKAYGAIYFIDGLDPASRMPDSFKPTYPYLYELNAKFGWDVISAKYPNAEKDIAGSVPRSVQYVTERVKALKAEGYKKIVLAGQSWGAWVSISVADHDDSAKLLDGLLIVAPAAYGAKNLGGKDNPYYLQNLTEYVRTIKSVRTPTVAVFFKDDDYDPGERGDVTDAFFSRSKTPLLLIDRPAGLAGHGAGWLPSFADTYASCIGDFFKTPKESKCSAPLSATAKTPLSTLTEQQVRKDQSIKPALQQDVAGKSFILTSPAIEVRVLKFGESKVEVAMADGVFDVGLKTSENEVCLDGECFRLYRVSNDRYLSFFTDGEFAGWLTPVD
jgi:pimeloyl-ACP methyl ester carboxylesterase